MSKYDASFSYTTQIRAEEKSKFEVVSDWGKFHNDLIVEHKPAYLSLILEDKIFEGRVPLVTVHPNPRTISVVWSFRFVGYGD
jgi:hypothetical protein